MNNFEIYINFICVFRDTKLDYSLTSKMCLTSIYNYMSKIRCKIDLLQRFRRYSIVLPVATRLNRTLNFNIVKTEIIKKLMNIYIWISLTVDKNDDNYDIFIFLLFPIKTLKRVGHVFSVKISLRINLFNCYFLHIRSSLAKKYLKLDLLNRFTNCFSLCFLFHFYDKY